jgi:hypothetical protein
LGRWPWTRGLLSGLARVRLCDIAASMGVAERSAYGIVTGLAAAG